MCGKKLDIDVAKRRTISSDVNDAILFIFNFLLFESLTRERFQTRNTASLHLPSFPAPGIFHQRVPIRRPFGRNLIQVFLISGAVFLQLVTADRCDSRLRAMPSRDFPFLACKLARRRAKTSSIHRDARVKLFARRNSMSNRSLPSVPSPPPPPRPVATK